jgi:O-antigen ligase
LIGTIFATLSFYLTNIRVVNPIISINTVATQNAFVFTLLCTIPISFYYILAKFGKKGAVISFPIFLVTMLLTNGRAGAIIILIQLLFIATIIVPSIHKTMKVLGIIMSLAFFIFQSTNVQPLLEAFARQVEPINTRFANLIVGKDDGDLTFDKSWLIRKLMVDKGVEIFKTHPILGIGPGNFTYFDTPLSSFYEYDRLKFESKEFYNSRSAHNSYIQILAEMGLVGFSILILLLGIPIFFLLKEFLFGNLRISYLPFVSLFGISMHFYAISSITGAIPWLVIGLSWAIISNFK